jgi:hypothetical protein
MTAFNRLINISSFKSSFQELLDLTDDRRLAVLDALNQFHQDPEADDSPRDESLLPAYSVLRTIRTVAAKEGLDELLRDIRAATPDDTDEKLAPLLPYLNPSEEENEVAFVRDVEESTLPVLLHIKFDLDYRVGNHDDAIKLIPLFVGRFGFDEATIGGSDVAVFQLNAATLKKMRGQIDDALELLQSSAKAIKGEYLPSPFAAKLAEEE